ncbi:helix-turn-helix domain-containing protein [Nocardia arthritidis]|uniref:Helix-turn-helix domain-containing protein n=1 Tax=Nocardia arthritidis TaxID=228602 RepID=A0A6G9YLX2_9NOCA|nr:helix-turn-helix transcriptional regulator [Nocardia arthritidis]QIS14067.1 helix-turn-helix domain-containing protein [Nocardia arthritidis]
MDTIFDSVLWDYPPGPSAPRVEFGGLRMVSMSAGHGTSASLEPAEWVHSGVECWYRVRIPLRESARVAEPRCAAIVSSVPRVGLPVSMCWDPGEDVVIVRFAPELMRSYLLSRFGRIPAEPLLFYLEVLIEHSGTESWPTLVRLVMTTRAERPESGTGGAERLLTAHLMLSPPRDRPAEPSRRSITMAPRSIRRAAELIEKHSAEPLTIADIAEAVGVGTRTIQAGFRRYLHTTPIAYLREIRLRRAHSVLLAADDRVTTVSEIATECGFAHLGRFATLYRRRYGEPPSATLRR